MKKVMLRATYILIAGLVGLGEWALWTSIVKHSSLGNEMYVNISVASFFHVFILLFVIFSIHWFSDVK